MLGCTQRKPRLKPHRAARCDRGDWFLRLTIIAEVVSQDEGVVAIENPATSLLWKRAVADPFPHRVTLDYCQFSSEMGYRKRTKLATNTAFEGRPLCNPRTCAACVDGRHIKSAQRGPCKGKDPRTDRCTLDVLHSYPPQLCEEIYAFCANLV